MAEPLSFENHIKLNNEIYNTNLITLRAKSILSCKLNDVVAQAMFKCLVESSSDQYSLQAARLTSEEIEESGSDVESVTNEESETEHDSDSLADLDSVESGGRPRSIIDPARIYDLTNPESSEEESSAEGFSDDATEESDATASKEIKGVATKRRRDVSSHEDELDDLKRDKKNKKIKERHQADRSGRPSHALCKKCSSVFPSDDNEEGDCFYHSGDLEVPEDDDGDYWADHDERCHGTIDSDEMRLEHPEAYEWDCCYKDGLSAPCEAGA